jgi:recombination protein RecA
MSNTPLVKADFEKFLTPVEQLRPPEGLPTGLDVFDNFLLWKGIPKGDISLFNGRPGAGATSLWINTVQKIHESKKWVAWVNSDCELMPSALLSKKIDLQRLLVVKKPETNEKMFWVIQELISSSLFELVGCHIQDTMFKNHQLQKLKKLARLHKVAFVIISHAKQWTLNPLFSLVIDCARDFFTVRRALHRPTPFSIQGSIVYAGLSHQTSSTSIDIRRLYRGALHC